MGVPVCRHLVRAGHRVIACDADERRRGPAEEAGASWAASIEGLGKGVDVALICVGYEAQARDVLFGARGLAGALRAGAVVVVVSTVSPKAVQDWAVALQQRQVALVDAAVCRGGWAADAGSLLTFVGGASDVVERVRGVLDCYSSDVLHVGDVGAGQACKAVNNMILWACLVADHEGLALAQRYGVDTEVLRKALITSTAANQSLEDWGRQTMAWSQDDMAIVLDMADECGISLPQAGVTREICRQLKPRRFDLAAYGA
jgi:3-hydroxyisobutyrate dehydrogenase-like beta-hydroxyacid dehydrogenase